ncbi:uncharacterized protein PAC_09858 [Phialocephala subalpina]|uniref:Uncharacterized protein n=1 Tax=Phialocephala subalpina TaxID=576137 RepID=A0A1L7X4L9_9HELO|nr:uncharacterized protein PAC_09858 [Phialocephala subalpina]
MSPIGKSCPGYRQAQDLLFRNRDKQSFACKGVAGRRNQGGFCSSLPEAGSKKEFLSLNSKSPSLSNDTFELDPINCTASPTPPTLAPQPVEHWHMYCVPIVLNQFSTLMNGVPYYGLHEFLPELYSEVNDNSCLSFATKTFVKAYLTNLSRSPPDKELIHTYGRALWLTNAAVQDPVESVKDSTVIAVWLLGIHEVWRNSMLRLQITDGFRLLLIRPKTAQLPHLKHITYTPKVSHLCFVSEARTSSQQEGVQTHCLVSNTDFPLQSLSWFELLRPQLSEDERFLFAVSTYNYRISSLCMKIRPYFKNLSTDPAPTLQATHIFAEVDRLQKEIQIWKDNVTIDPFNFASLHFYNSLRSAQLKLHYFEVLLINRIDTQSMTDIPLRRKHTIRTIEILAEEILNEVPVTLGNRSARLIPGGGCWADGLRLMWPLLAVSWVPCVRRQQRVEARNVLQRIGRQTGIHFALDCDPPPGRFPQEEMARGS